MVLKYPTWQSRPTSQQSSLRSLSILFLLQSLYFPENDQKQTPKIILQWDFFLIALVSEQSTDWTLFYYQLMHITLKNAELLVNY